MAAMIAARAEAEALPFPTAAELERVAWGVQWAGHLATLAADCRAGGPAFSSIAEATDILERNAAPVRHNTATRSMVNATRQIEHERNVAAALKRTAARA
jgi:hypothetical protein